MSTPTLTDRVRQRLVTSPGDLREAIRAEAGGIVDDAVLDRLRVEVGAQLLGFGPLEGLVGLAGVTDIVVNGPGSVWFDRGNGLERSAITFPETADVRGLAQRLVTSAGRRLDDAAPFADAVLADGTRVHAVLPPIAREPLLSLRLFTYRGRSLDDLVVAGAATAGVAELLRAIVAARLAFVISGGTGVGKTTLLGSLLALVPTEQRIVVVEDTAELAVGHPHVVGLCTRAANVEGAGAIGLRELVRQSLRMRPDRLVVGEFRGAEMVELLVALNTGHEGGAATLHANAAAAVPARLLALGGLAGLSRPAVAGLAAAGLHVVIHLQRMAGQRSVSEVALLRLVGDEFTTSTVWSYGAGRGAAADEMAALLGERGAAAMPTVLR